MDSKHPVELSVRCELTPINLRQRGYFSITIRNSRLRKCTTHCVRFEDCRCGRKVRHYQTLFAAALKEDKTQPSQNIDRQIVMEGLHMKLPQWVTVWDSFIRLLPAIVVATSPVRKKTLDQLWFTHSILISACYHFRFSIDLPLRRNPLWASSPTLNGIPSLIMQYCNPNHLKLVTWFVQNETGIQVPAFILFS